MVGNSWCLLLVLALGMSCTCVADEPLDASLIWRTPACDAANCAYLMARSKGFELDWESLQNQLDRPNVSLLDIRDTLLAAGVNCQVTKPTLDELQAGIRPTIVLLDSDRANGSSFALFVHCDGKKVDVVNGGSATTGETTKEEFLRSWTGHALTVVDPESSDMVSSNWLLVFGLAVVGYLVLRLR